MKQIFGNLPPVLENFYRMVVKTESLHHIQDSWVLSASTTSEFLMAMLAYEFVFDMKHQPEAFYWITEEELATIQAKMHKLSYEVHNWLYEMEIALYTNALDNIVAVMDCCGDLQVLYGANSEDGYAKLMAVMEGVGEEM